MVCDSADVEALRLMRAFFRITDPKTRSVILDLVEAAARGAQLSVESDKTGKVLAFPPRH